MATSLVLLATHQAAYWPAERAVSMSVYMSAQMCLTAWRPPMRRLNWTRILA